MNISKKLLRFASLSMFGAVLLAGCVSVPVDFGRTADQNYDSARGRPISAKACGFQIGRAHV